MLFFYFLFIKESWKKHEVAVFNTDSNTKCFLSSKSAYYYDFWRSCALKAGVMMLKIQLWISGINDILIGTQIENSYLK